MICWPLCISSDRQAGWTDSVSYSRTMAELIALLYNLTSKIHQHWLPLLGLRTAGMREAFPPYLELRLGFVNGKVVVTFMLISFQEY